MSPETAGTNHSLFYDTYALYAIAIGQEAYAPFTKNHRILTTLMNLYELYYTLCKEGQEALAENFFQRLLSSCLDISPETIMQAAKFRLQFRKKDLSYIDALGYCTARAEGVLFLTGDKGFQDLPFVRFVK